MNFPSFCIDEQWTFQERLVVSFSFCSSLPLSVCLSVRPSIASSSSPPSRFPLPLFQFSPFSFPPSRCLPSQTQQQTQTRQCRVKERGESAQQCSDQLAEPVAKGPNPGKSPTRLLFRTIKDHLYPPPDLFIIDCDAIDLPAVCNSPPPVVSIFPNLSPRVSLSFSRPRPAPWCICTPPFPISNQTLIFPLFCFDCLRQLFPSPSSGRH